MCVVRDGAEAARADRAHRARSVRGAPSTRPPWPARLRSRHTGVKRALLDQSLVSGVGNIYADEALWRARLHWARPTETLNGPEVSRLLAAVREVLAEALVAGGTSFDDMYVNVNGESGYFERSLAVYGREGFPVPAVRHAGPARPLHEPVRLQLPALPAPRPATLTGSPSRAQLTRQARWPGRSVTPR